MKISMVLERTRKVVVEVEADDKKFLAVVTDHFDSENPSTVYAGNEVTLLQIGVDGIVRGISFIPIKVWPAIREMINRAISEFESAYPESPHG